MSGYEKMRILFFLGIILISIASVLQAAELTEFTVRVSVRAEGEHQSATGTGSFAVTENNYGRINIALQDDGKGLRIVALGSEQKPVSYFQESAGVRFKDGFQVIADLYLKPNLTESGEIHLTGMLSRMTDVTTNGSPLYEYWERELDFIIPDGGVCSINLEKESESNKIYLDISAYIAGLSADEQELDRRAIFETEYGLFNEDTREIELKGEKCILTFSTSGPGGQSECNYRKIFTLPAGDLLLYASAYKIENVIWNNDGTLTFDFELTHLYAINPEDTSADASELKSDKTTMTMLSRTVTVQPGERTEIEIPADKDSPLPFRARELIVLVNPEEFIPVDKMPELIYTTTPKYPASAKKSDITGSVTIKAFIDENGVVRSARVAKCNRPGYGFEEAALEAAYNNRYSAAIRRGKPIGVWVTYTVTFTLED